MYKEIIEKAFDEYYHKNGTGEWSDDEIMKDAFISGFFVWHGLFVEPVIR